MKSQSWKKTLPRRVLEFIARRSLNVTIVPEIGFHYIEGNALPYFSVTATIYEGRRETGGGCCHAEILQVFPELKPAIPWHLADLQGVPMHYVANGMYFLEQGKIETFKSHCLIGRLDGDAAAWVEMPLPLVRERLENRAPFLRAAMLEDLASTGVDIEIPVWNV